MKSRKEIEELLGKELQYVQHEVRSNSDWGNFGIDVLDTYWELTEDDIKKVKDLLESSIESNDIEKINNFLQIRDDNYAIENYILYTKEEMEKVLDDNIRFLFEIISSLEENKKN